MPKDRVWRRVHPHCVDKTFLQRQIEVVSLAFPLRGFCRSTASAYIRRYLFAERPCLRAASIASSARCCLSLTVVFVIATPSSPSQMADS